MTTPRDDTFRRVMRYVTDWARADDAREQAVMAALFDVLNGRGKTSRFRWPGRTP
jgi:hypothetical protein